jgi:hypothetical protein
MNVYAVVDGMPRVGLTAKVIKRRGGPPVVLEEKITRMRAGDVTLSAQLPTDPEYRARAVRVLIEDCAFYWCETLVIED